MHFDFSAHMATVIQFGSYGIEKNYRYTTTVNAVKKACYTASTFDWPTTQGINENL